MWKAKEKLTEFRASTEAPQKRQHKYMTIHFVLSTFETEMHHNSLHFVIIGDLVLQKAVYLFHKSEKQLKHATVVVSAEKLNL
jgi:hypothetical protein